MTHVCILILYTGSTLYVSNENADPVTGVSYVIAVAVDKVTGALTVRERERERERARARACDSETQRETPHLH